MSDPSQEKENPSSATLGQLPLLDDSDRRLPASDLVAIAVSVVWLLLMGIMFFASGPVPMSGMSTVMLIVGILLPIVMVWFASVTIRTTRMMRSETRRLQTSIEAMRQSLQDRAAVARPSVEKRLDEIAAAARQAENAIVTFTSRRDGVTSHAAADQNAALGSLPPTRQVENQPALALGTPAEELAQPVSIADFIKALDFPDGQDDREGIRALRRALDDRTLAKLIRAAQDVLTLLGEDGIYMDDLKPDRARPELWRRFAHGERGKTVGGLGGIRDRSSLALTAGRMRQDTIFRDAAHHFLRQFDMTIGAFEKNASDQDLSELAETRTARAFMLLARVSGTFD